MFRFIRYVAFFLSTFFSLPQAAYAANFGFVRWPDYLDMPIASSMIATAVFSVVFKAILPKGAKDYVSVPKEERPLLLKATGLFMLASLGICIGLIFLGMGLQRASEM
ncbi:hypothetical protein [Roseibium album]|uniref:hypothetical protein n=1 Tax=Roseibium album TaxID=311410 RepID=UPI002490CA56|nr:hypothetical protein [Roseibium album]